MRKTNTASPSTQGQARRFASAAILCALALSACSPSIPQGAQWTDDPFRTDSSSSSQAGSASAVAKHTKASGDQGIPRGSGTLRIAYAPGWQLPADYISAFEAASGYTIEQFPASSISSSLDADILFGIDSATAASLGATTSPTVIGNDPICAYADRSWFSANRKALPHSLAELSSSTYAPLTALPPENSPIGSQYIAHAQKALGANFEDWAADLHESGSFSSSTGDALGQWSVTIPADRASIIPEAESAQGSHARPILVWDARLAVAAASNTGTESRAQAIPGSCVSREVLAAPLPASTHAEAVDSFRAFLSSQLGKDAAAYAGLAYNEGIATDSRAAWFMAPAN